MLALIAGLLALPFIIAFLLWHFGWQPGRAGNHGQLLAGANLPVLQLQENHFQKISTDATFSPAGAEKGLAPDTMLGHWLLALAVPAECDADCLAQLQLARQVQVSLNKEMTRLKRGLIGPQLKDLAALKAAQQRWPDLRIARLDGAAWPTLRSADGAPHLYLIDPRGQLVLRYPAAPDPKGVRRDLERLLKYSWLG